MSVQITLLQAHEPRAATSRARVMRVICASLVALTIGAVASLIAAPNRAAAITDDYCGVYKTANQRCFQGGGYLNWRYHQASTAGIVVLPYLCVQSTTAAGNERNGSGCSPSTDFRSFHNCSDTPAANSSINWDGPNPSNQYRLYGHADNRGC